MSSRRICGGYHYERTCQASGSQKGGVGVSGVLEVSIPGMESQISFVSSLSQMFVANRDNT